MTWLVGLALLGGASWIGLLAYRSGVRGAERATRPRALIGADLAYMETTFRIQAPIQLVAKVDRAYRLPDGTVVLVELKTRWSHAVRTTDVIQLSAQKLALEEMTGFRVAQYAFVSTMLPTGRLALRHHRVALLDSATVVALALRRQAVIQGQVLATGPHAKHTCASCAFRPTCALRGHRSRPL
jgi:CRISPR-associated exonuclease Cas4